MSKLLKTLKEDSKFIALIVLKQFGIGLIITIITLSSCYLLKHRTINNYCDILAYVGAAIVTIGLFSLMSTMQTSTSYSNNMSASAGGTKFSDVTNRNRKLLAGAYSFFLKSIFTSIIPFCCSLLISTIWKYQ